MKRRGFLGLTVSLFLTSEAVARRPQSKFSALESMVSDAFDAFNRQNYDDYFLHYDPRWLEMDSFCAHQTTHAKFVFKVHGAIKSFTVEKSTVSERSALLKYDVRCQRGHLWAVANFVSRKGEYRIININFGGKD